MDLLVLDDIEPAIDVERLASKLRVDAGGPAMAEAFGRLVDEAMEVLRPKAVYKLAAFDRRDDTTVVIDGVALTSRVLAYHLQDIYRVFPFVATCGREVAEWARSKTDMMERYWAEAIMDRALTCAGEALGEELRQRYRLEKAGAMTPGSLMDWPIQEQLPLFEILGDIEGAIGVRLTEGLMMDPVHSVSGVLFPTEVDFEECQLCPREDCPKRRAPFEEHLYEERYGGAS